MDRPGPDATPGGVRAPGDRRDRPATDGPLSGRQGHHQPAARAAQLLPVLATRGINVTYTEALSDLNPTTLAKYDVLMIYANSERIEPDQEQAILDYVEGEAGSHRSTVPRTAS